MLKTLKNFGICLAILLFVVGAYENADFLLKSVKEAKASIEFTYYGSGTNTGILCKKGASTLLSTSTPARNYIRITNAGNGINPMWIGLGTSAATSTGILLTASSTWELGASNLSYGGPIYCLTENADATATVVTIP